MKPRYWMSLTPLFLIGLAALIACGSPSAWSRAWRAVALAGWVGISFVGLRELWSPRIAKEDWRGAAAWISAYAGPGDGALFFVEYIRFPFFHYYWKPLDHRAFAHPIPDRSAAEETLNALGLEEYETLWYIRAHADWADPQDWVDQVLRSRYPVRMEIFPEKIRIRAYAIHWQREDLPPDVRPTAVALPGGWFLRGLQHAGGRGVRPRSWEVFPPTRQLHLVLYWQRASTGGPPARRPDGSGRPHPRGGAPSARRLDLPPAAIPVASRPDHRGRPRSVPAGGSPLRPILSGRLD